MKKFYYLLLLPLIAISSILCSCSDDDKPAPPYDPYSKQEKEPFYPREIIIGKQSNNRDILETWTFDYNDQKAITSYTHETVTTRTTENGIEKKTEKEQGNLSYYPNGDIVNKITFESNIENADYHVKEKEVITENVVCTDGLIAEITRHTDLYDENEKIKKSYITTRTFKYSTGGRCKSSIFTDEFNADGPTTHTYKYNWDKKYRLESIDIEEKSSKARTRKAYYYTYGEIDKNRSFQTNAFVYNHMPQIYAAMGYLGKDCPFVIENEQQDFEFFVDGNWETDNSADEKIYTLLNTDTDEFKYDISSDIYNINYYIKFIK